MNAEELQNFWQEYYQDVKPEANKGHWAFWELLAQAQPDECYYGAGNPMNFYNPFLVPPCPDGGRPKTNQAYVWGMTKVGPQIWYGTMANTQCMVLNSMIAGGIPGLSFPAIQTNSWVCEFSDSQFYLPSPPFPPGIATDWRPPRIFMYDTATMTLEEKTYIIPMPYAMLLNTTIGFRAAGSIGDLVFIAGPSILGGINIFAFDAASGMFLTATNLPGYNNIRNMITVDGVMYLGVSVTEGGGHILRWTGDAPMFHNGRFLENFVDLFQFDIVGYLDSDAANMALHQGRLFVTTWPNINIIEESNLAGLYMSPVIPSGGLTAAHAADWQKVWQVDQYEPDPVVARSYGGGALASFQGRLYWGTMHVPLTSLLAWFQAYGIDGLEDIDDALLAVLGTWRNTTLFVGRDFGDPEKQPRVELMYGMPYLPVYHPKDGWSIEPNNMPYYQRHPLHGFSGFDNFFNAYTWTMCVYNEQLYVGTFDWSYLAYDLIDTIIDPIAGPLPKEALKLPTSPFGADLFRIAAKNVAAKPENITGLGNSMNYGIRTMLADEDGLFIGTANPMNLVPPATPINPENPIKAQQPAGGWQLIRMADIENDLLCSGYAHPFMTHEGETVKFHVDTDVSEAMFAETVWSFGDGTIGIGGYASHQYEFPGVYLWTMAIITEGDVCFDAGYVIILPTCDPDLVIVDDNGQCVLSICSHTGEYTLEIETPDYQGVITGVGLFYDCHAAGRNGGVADTLCFMSSPEDPWFLDVKCEEEHEVCAGFFLYPDKGIVLDFFRSSDDGPVD
jgi:hypothetical protein